MPEDLISRSALVDALKMRQATILYFASPASRGQREKFGNEEHGVEWYSGRLREIALLIDELEKGLLP